MPFKDNTYLVLNGTHYLIIAGHDVAYPIAPAIKDKFPGNDVGVENLAWLKAHGITISPPGQGNNALLNIGKNELHKACAAAGAAKNHLIAALQASRTDHPDIVSNEHHAIILQHTNDAVKTTNAAIQHLDSAAVATATSMDTAKAHMQTTLNQTLRAAHTKEISALEKAIDHASMGEKTINTMKQNTSKCGCSAWIIIILILIAFYILL